MTKKIRGERTIVAKKGTITRVNVEHPIKQGYLEKKYGAKITYVGPIKRVRFLHGKKLSEYHYFSEVLLWKPTQQRTQRGTTRQKPRGMAGKLVKGY